MPSLTPFIPVDATGSLPRTARSGIYYEIESLTVKDAWAPGANLTTIGCRVRWTDSQVWITDMVGRARRATDALGNIYLSRDLPERVPFINPDASASYNFGGQWCTRVEQIDQGGDPGADPVTGWPVIDWIRYRATFDGLPYAVLQDSAIGPFGGELGRYVSRSRRPKASLQQVPFGKVYFAGVPGPVSIPGASWVKRVTSADVQYIWHRLPVAAIPTVAMTAALNTVNIAPWDTGVAGYNWDQGILLFTGWDDANRYWDANQDWVVDLVLYFDMINKGPIAGGGPPGFQAAGWNYFINPMGQPVAGSLDGKPLNYALGTGNAIYPGTDFNALVQIQ